MGEGGVLKGDGRASSGENVKGVMAACRRQEQRRRIGEERRLKGRECFNSKYIKELCSRASEWKKFRKMESSNMTG